MGRQWHAVIVTVFACALTMTVNGTTAENGFRGMAVKDEVMAVAGPTDVRLYQTCFWETKPEEIVVPIAKIPLPSELSQDPDVFSAFELLHNNSLFACSLYNCWLYIEKEWSLIPIQNKNKRIKFAKVVVTTMLANTDARLFFAVSPLNELNSTYFVATAQAKDSVAILLPEPHGWMNKFEYSFVYGNYVYFIGNTMQDGISNKIRMVRFCAEDSSEQLTSRVNIVLTCNKVPEEVDVEATAVFFDGKTMWVAVRVGGSPNRKALCFFSMVALVAHFQAIWRNCRVTAGWDPMREMTFAESLCIAVNEECEKIRESDLGFSLQHLNCFSVDVWKCCNPFENPMSIHEDDYCAGGVMYTNEGLIGWLENEQTMLSTDTQFVDTNESITALHPSSDSMLALTTSGILRLVSEKDQILILHRLTKFAHTKKLAFHAPSNTLIAANKKGSIKILSITCDRLYRKCSPDMATDPLACHFCARPDGTGFAMARSEGTCPANTESHDKHCPPVIKRVKVSLTLYEIDFALTPDLAPIPHVLVCNSICERLYASLYSCPAAHCIAFCEVTVVARATADNVSLHSVLRIRVPKTSPWSVWEMLAASLLLFALLALVTCALYFGGRRYRRRKIALRPEFTVTTPLGKAVVPFSETVAKITPNIEIHRDDSQNVLRPIRLVGGGHFSDVYFGHIEYEDKEKNGQYEEVAIKVPKPGVSATEVDSEISLLKDCFHQNIVRLISAYPNPMTPDTMLIVTEFMEGGSLKDLLTAGTRFSINTQRAYMSQVVEGMAYLHRRSIVHRDLSIRNCLLDSTRQILKISDFGLSRRMNADYAYVSSGTSEHVVLPFRHISPEAILDFSRFCKAADVWAFGVAVWEIFSDGQTPYESINDVRSLQTFLAEGHRLLRPTNCPIEIFDVVLYCWDAEPKMRPSFSELRLKLQRVFDAFNASEHVYKVLK